MGKNKFREIEKIDELIGFLESKGRNHNNFYHYTNKEGLRGMLISRKMHISSGDLMNDKQELTKGDIEIWQSLYLSSFNYGEEENMAMWGLYGVPREDAIRIAISGPIMRNWINNVNRFYVVTFENGRYEYNKILSECEIKLTDIVYVSGKLSDEKFNLRRSRDKLEVNRRSSLGKVSSNSSMTGYVKNAAWSYENEVRIRIRTEKSISQKRIAIDIPDEVIDDMSLLLGPGYDDNDCIEDQKFKNMKWEDSGFKGLVNYRDKCCFCKSSFQRK